MCKNEDLVFMWGCVEKNTVCAGVPSAFVFVLKWWFLTLDPGWQMEAGTEQALVKESGGSPLLCTYTRRCLLCSFRRRDEGDKSPGPYVWAGSRACVNLLCG